MDKNNPYLYFTKGYVQFRDAIALVKGTLANLNKFLLTPAQEEELRPALAEAKRPWLN